MTGPSTGWVRVVDKERHRLVCLHSREEGHWTDFDDLGAAADVGVGPCHGQVAGARWLPADELAIVVGEGSVRVRQPVARPEKIICLGHNFRSHIEEMGRPIPPHPVLFAKYWRALTGPYDEIVIPPETGMLDWEAELGVVIGRTARHVQEADANEYIAGYTVVNDVSARDFQWRTTQFLQGKTFESTTPVGPAVIRGEAIDWARDLRIRCCVDGEVVQEATTADLIFGPSFVIAYLSAIVTLVPGDVIAMGTPGGVGAGRTPPRYLRPGEVLTTEIEGIGVMRNRITSGGRGRGSPQDMDH